MLKPNGWMQWIAGAALPILLAACVPATAPPPPSRATAVRVPSVTPPGAVSTPPRSLVAAIDALGRGFDGRVGIAVRDVQAGWVVSYNGANPMPQQSVSKMWVAMTALDAVDRGAIALSDPITVRREDLTLFHQPISAMIGRNGYATTLRDLMTIALTRSDNTANDVILRKAGGPQAVRDFLARRRLYGVGFGPGERPMQSAIAGLEWKPSYAIGRTFFEARAALPFATRQAALQRYLADPVDGASPEGIAAGLARLRKGELLSPASTQLLLATMASSKTGPQRLKGGLSDGWAFAHKTGTGQELGDLATGYNDVGLLTGPGGESYAIAVMIASTRRPIPERMRLMSAVTRAVIAQQEGGRFASRSPF